VKKIIETLLS